MSNLQFAKIYGHVVSTYPALLRHLYSINGKISDCMPAPNSFSKLNTQKLYDAIGRPLDRIPSVLVGGTNGKGSTCLKVANGLQVSGFRTGLFVSPHISSYRERVQVNGLLIEESEVMILAPKILDICLSHEIPATLFEITFAMACLQFESMACDAVVLEVGVGGEWDATNVVMSALSILCSVDLDHTRILGPTIEAIAANKAGIFKALRPALHGPGCPREVLVEAATVRDSILFSMQDALNLRVPGGSAEASLSELNLEDVTYTDKLNSRLALAGLNLLKAASLGVLSDRGPGLCSVSATDKELYARFNRLLLSSPEMAAAMSITAPCRWERVCVPVHISGGAEHQVVAPVNVDVVMDLGHNPAAISALMRRAKQEFVGKRVRIIYGMSRDKNVNKCIEQLLHVARSADLFFVQSKNFRAISVDEMHQRLTEVAGEDSEISTLNSTELLDIVNEVLQLCAKSSVEDGADSDNVLLICGSAYFMPQVRAAVGIIEPRDDIDLSRE